jgi:hypothetical protein
MAFIDLGANRVRFHSEDVAECAISTLYRLHKGGPIVGFQ